jgi:hypothetical protein
MIYAVEIRGPNGGRATKEYESTSMRGALRLASIDLKDHPQCEIIDIILRADWENTVGSDEW